MVEPARPARPTVVEGPHAPAVVCTGNSASWCPIHGTCTCPRDGEGLPIEGLDDPGCPLHRDGTLHAEGPTDDDPVPFDYVRHRVAVVIAEHPSTPNGLTNDLTDAVWRVVEPELYAARRQRW